MNFILMFAILIFLAFSVYVAISLLILAFKKYEMPDIEDISESEN